MTTRIGKSYMPMTVQDMNADFQPVWTCRCGAVNTLDLQVCQWCSKKRPPQISLGGKIR